MDEAPATQHYWPHAPPHWLFAPGVYFVTASTFHRQRHFDSPACLSIVTERLIDTAKVFGWSLHAWAVFSNHYHFLAQSPEADGESLRAWLREFHRTTATRVNARSGKTGRRVWMSFRDKHITYQKSYLARLNYINHNPVKHGLVAQSEDYAWCSARWFSTNAPRGFVESVGRFKTDQLKVWDDFDV